MAYVDKHLREYLHIHGMSASLCTGRVTAFHKASSWDFNLVCSNSVDGPFPRRLVMKITTCLVSCMRDNVRTVKETQTKRSCRCLMYIPPTGGFNDKTFPICNLMYLYASLGIFPSYGNLFLSLKYTLRS